jgi:DHA2 family multidrug resistance protein
MTDIADDFATGVDSFSRTVITAAVSAATIMVSLDSTIANVALPRVQGELSATQDQMGWVLTSYIVASAIFIPLTGWLSNAFGLRRVLHISIVIFTGASVLCGVATTLPQLVLFRLLQGIGGAALVPMSQAVLLRVNHPKDYARVMAMWAAAVQAGNIAGPMLGGWLTDNMSWRWIFFINVPIGVLAFLGLLSLREERIAVRPRFDVMGFTVLSVAVGALQLMLDRGQQLDWFSSAEIVTEALVAGIALYVFIVHMFTSDRPFLNPRLFLDRNFVTSSLFISVVGVVLFGTLALLPPMLQSEMNYPVVLAGLVIAPRGLGTLLAMALSAKLASMMDGRVVTAAGLLTIAYSMWLMTQFSPDMSYAPVVISGALQGLGVALIYVPVTTYAFSTLSPELRNEGTAFFSLARNLGSSIGISVVLFMFVRNTQTMHESLTAELRTPATDPTSAAVAAHVTPWADRSWAALNDYVTHQAAFVAYVDDYKFMMLATLVVLPFVFLLRKGRPTGEPLPAME